MEQEETAMALEVQLEPGWLMRDVGKAVKRRRVWSSSKYNNMPLEEQSRSEGAEQTPDDHAREVQEAERVE